MFAKETVGEGAVVRQIVDIVLVDRLHGPLCTLYDCLFIGLKGEHLLHSEASSILYILAGEFAEFAHVDIVAPGYAVLTFPVKYGWEAHNFDLLDVEVGAHGLQVRLQVSQCGPYVFDFGVEFVQEQVRMDAFAVGGSLEVQVWEYGGQMLGEGPCTFWSAFFLYFLNVDINGDEGPFV